MLEDLIRVAVGLQREGRLTDLNDLLAKAKRHEDTQLGARIALFAWAGTRPNRMEFMITELKLRTAKRQGFI